MTFFLRLSLLLILVGQGRLHALSCENSDPGLQAMGGVGTALPFGPVSLFHHTAWLSETERFQSTLSIMNPYDMPGLYSGNAAFSIPLKPFTLGGGMAFLILDSIYNEIEWGIGSAVQYKQVYFGANGRLNYMTFPKNHGYCLESAMDASVTVMPYHPLFLSIGFREFSILTGGVGYLGQYLWAGMEADYQAGFPLNVRFGQALNLFDVLALRAGVSTEPLTFSFGVGFSFMGMGADMAAQTHTELGLSKSIGVRMGASTTSAQCLSNKEKFAGR